VGRFKWNIVYYIRIKNESILDRAIRAKFVDDAVDDIDKNYCLVETLGPLGNVVRVGTEFK
jgi:hypothetical protein